jgi:hypothetical protein
VACERSQRSLARCRVDDITVCRWVKQGVLEAIILPHKNERQAHLIKREALDTMLCQAASGLN